MEGCGWSCCSLIFFIAFSTTGTGSWDTWSSIGKPVTSGTCPCSSTQEVLYVICLFSSWYLGKKYKHGLNPQSRVYMYSCLWEMIVYFGHGLWWCVQQSKCPGALTHWTIRKWCQSYMFSRRGLILTDSTEPSSDVKVLNVIWGEIWCSSCTKQ